LRKEIAQKNAMSSNHSGHGAAPGKIRKKIFLGNPPTDEILRDESSGQKSVTMKTKPSALIGKEKEKQKKREKLPSRPP